MRVIAYARVSTAEQGADGLGMAAQRTQLAQECHARGLTLLDIEEDVTSGKSTNGRHGLARAMARIAAGEADALMVTKLDRLARSTLDFANILERACREGWALIILELAFDLSAPMGKFTAHIIAAVAQLEREMIGERTKAALAERRRQGLPVGAPVSQAMRDPKTLALVKELRAQRMSLRAIAAELSRRGVPAPAGGSWNHESVRKAVLAD
jgi:DNA invertase Pin-like site-specific DNA recombinase